MSPTYSLVDKSVDVLGIAAERCSAVAPWVKLFCHHCFIT